MTKRMHGEFMLKRAIRYLNDKVEKVIGTDSRQQEIPINESNTHSPPTGSSYMDGTIPIREDLQLNRV
jgi:hypothetical protein